MSLYNTLFGVNEEMPVLLGIIGVNMEYFQRFRDVEITNGGVTIRVFTRLGGGNREYYKETWKKIRSHELYATDYDDSYDNTYAYIEYKIPEKYKKTVLKMYKGEPISFKEKFEKELREMEIPGTDAYKRSLEISKKFISSLESNNDNGDIKIIEI